jgi:hypothetical protein
MTNIQFNFDQGYFNLKFENGNSIVVTVIPEGECGNGVFCYCGKLRMLTSYGEKVFKVEAPNTYQIQDTIDQMIVLSGKIKSLNGKQV